MALKTTERELLIHGSESQASQIDDVIPGSGTPVRGCRALRVVAAAIVTRPSAMPMRLVGPARSALRRITYDHFVKLD
jgi:hypothetical protein